MLLPRKVTCLLLSLLCSFAISCTFAASAAEKKNNIPANAVASEQNANKGKKVLYANLASAAVIIGYGITKWDYGDTISPINNEGWFGKSTKHGGMDKLGHFYSTYLASRLLTKLYQHWGYDNQSGARLALLSSLGLSTLMEVGDIFSKYGFSKEDMLANIAGSVSGYFLATRPNLANKIDFRIEYVPTPEGWGDFATDYNGMKFLLAFKLNGFLHNPHSLLQFVDLDIGYYARHCDQDPFNRRYLFAGIGIDLAQLFTRASHPTIGHIFNFYQVPYTYLPAKHELN